jgi:MFS family permease
LGRTRSIAVGTSLAIIAASQFIFSVAVQPTVGAISDYADTKWGRRKPFIVVGALFDAVFLVGIAYANSLLALAAFVVLLSLSTNTARGPFQGYVPDLVPDEQVGMASSMVGLFQVLGNVLGFLLGGIALSRGRRVAVLAVAVIEVGTMLSVVLRVPQGPIGEAAQRPIMAERRRRDLGNRHPPRAELHLALVRASSSLWAAPRC